MIWSCASHHGVDHTLSELDPEKFTTVIDGDSVWMVTLLNTSGMEVCLSNYGARILSIMVPDKDGHLRNVVLGFDSIQAYFPEMDLPKLGGTIGRYAGRIGNAEFCIGEDTIHLTANNGPHCLHGGAEDGDRGWQYRVYSIKERSDSSVTFAMRAPDGENGFPGNMDVLVKYTLMINNALKIEYKAQTDRSTVIGMANQSYFNLSGNPDNSISDLKLQINASSFLPIDSTQLVTGEILPVDDTPFDFRKEKLVGRDIDNAWNPQIRNGSGYDHSFILDSGGDLNQEAVSMRCRRSGIVMKIFTTEPAIQFYTGNYLHGSLSKKHNEDFSQRHGLSLETQHFPDSPNHPEWPNVVLNPGSIYSSTTIYKFEVKR